MKGILYKDFASTKKETRLCLGICVLFLLFALVTGSSGDTMAVAPTIGVMVAFGSMSPTYSLQYDKNSGWNRFICASPIARDKVILAKYVGGLFNAVEFTLFAVLANALTGNSLPLWSMGGVLLTILVLQAIMLPTCLKVGQNAVVVVFMLLVFVPIGGGILLKNAGILTDSFFNAITNAVASSSPVLLAAITVLLVALLYFLSYCLSCRFFRKMEF